MPLILLTGHPCSGKSTIVDRLVEKFKEIDREVHVIKEEQYESFSKECYNDATEEKDLRSWLRGEVQRRLNKNTIVICDGLNYIKGFRYELFLAAKLCNTTYCLVQITPSVKTCNWLNNQSENKYNDQQIEQLILRYERPDTKFRFEKPLFTIDVGTAEKATTSTYLNEEDISADLDYPSPRYANIHSEEIIDWIVKGVELTENKSTQVVAQPPSNYIHELDRGTQEVVKFYLDAQKTAVRGQNIVIPECGEESNSIKFIKARTLPELNRLRHQFVKTMINNPISDIRTIKSTFVDFLTTRLC